MFIIVSVFIIIKVSKHMVSSGMWESRLLWRSILHCINYVGHFWSVNGNQLTAAMRNGCSQVGKMLTICFLWESHWCVLSMWHYCYTFINRSAWFIMLPYGDVHCIRCNYLCDQCLYFQIWSNLTWNFAILPKQFNMKLNGINFKLRSLSSILQCMRIHLATVT